MTDLHVSGYPGKSLVAVYPGRTSLSGQTSPGKKSNPGIRAKPGHPGNHWSQLVPAGTSWVPAGTNPAGKPLYPGESWYLVIRANLGIRANQLIKPTRKLPDRFGRPPPIPSGYPGISRHPGNAIYRFRGTSGHPGGCDGSWNKTYVLKCVAPASDHGASDPDH